MEPGSAVPRAGSSSGSSACGRPRGSCRCAGGRGGGGRRGRGARRRGGGVGGQQPVDDAVRFGGVGGVVGVAVPVDGAAFAVEAESGGAVDGSAGVDLAAAGEALAPRFGEGGGGGVRGGRG